MGFKYMMVVGGSDTKLGLFEDETVDYILAFKSAKDRLKAKYIMLSHRRDDYELSDTENMLNALDDYCVNISGIDYEIFEDISEVWL